MSWTRQTDIKAQVQQWWDRGELLGELAGNETQFPRRLRFKHPTSAELSTRFEDARSWINDVRDIAHIRLQFQDIQHRVLGKNSVPVGAWVDTLDEALTIVNKRREADRFRSIVALTQGRHPAIVSYMARRPLLALQYALDWPKLLDITDWMLQHPRPDIFIRQLDIPGVHTKLIERCRGVLTELFELVLPEDTIDRQWSNVSGFEKRYGFREKPLRIRFRILDPEAAYIKCDGYQDITLDSDSFFSMQPNISNVFITENEVNYLAFTTLPASMVIFGSGYGLKFLAQAHWLKRCEVFYWGDIDTHGFSILNEARTNLPGLHSILMDRASLMAHQSLWVSEDTPHKAAELASLTPDEQRLYRDLKEQTLGRNIRLEQERIGWHYAWERIKGTI